MTVFTMKKNWVLCECGFDQKLFEGECKDQRIGTSIREIARFSSRPRVAVSSTWDSCHVYVTEAPGGSWSSKPERNADESRVVSQPERNADESRVPGDIKTSMRTVSILTTGRWKVILNEFQSQIPDKRVAQVVEIGDKVVLKSDDGELFSLQGKQVQQLSVPHQAVSVFPVRGGTAYARLGDGLLYKCTLTSNGLLNLTTPLLPGVPVKLVACGCDHSLLLSREGGRVWSSGLNHRGQLGHGDIQPRPQPSLVEALDGISIESVSCGRWHSLALSTCGDVYSWGWNLDHQLGHSADTATVATPTLVEIEEGEMDFQSVGCGSRHSTALSMSGVLYTWGWNAYGQLGPRNPLHRLGPAPVTGHGGAVSWVYCTPWSTLFLV